MTPSTLHRLHVRSPQLRFANRIVLVAAAAGILVSATACDKGPAEAALRSAEAALEAVQGEAERLVPEQVEAVRGLVTEARVRMARGDYGPAIEAVKDVPARVDEIAKAAARRKDELSRAWTRLQETVPQRLTALNARIAELAAKSTLPRDLSDDVFAQIKAQAAAFTAAWTEAVALYEKGELLAAANRAAGLRSRAEELLGKLEGILPP